MNGALPKKNIETTQLVGSVIVGRKEYVVRLKKILPVDTLERSRLFDIFPMSWGKYEPEVDVLGEKVAPSQGGKKIISEQVTRREAEGGVSYYNDMGTTLPRYLFYQPLQKKEGGRSEEARVKAIILSRLSTFEKCWDWITQTLSPRGFYKRLISEVIEKPDDLKFITCFTISMEKVSKGHFHSEFNDALPEFNVFKN